MSDRSSTAVYLRLSVDLHRWVADEALRGHRSMNAVVVEAIDLMTAARTERLARERHAAAIELAISTARLPECTTFLYRPGSHDHDTEVFILKPGQTEYSFLVRVNGEKVVSQGDHGENRGDQGGQPTGLVDR